MWKLEVNKNGNWVNLDVYSSEESPVSLNYRLDDILDFSKKKNPYSKSIKLPATPKNKDFFDHIEEINVSRDVLLQNMPARIRSGRDEQVFFGNLLLTNIEQSNKRKSEYTVTIVGIVRSFAAELQGCEITDLNTLDRYDHTRDLDTVVDSFTHLIDINGNRVQTTIGEGYVYPYINYGLNSNIGQYSHFFELYPATFVKTIWDALFEEMDRTYTSNFIESEYFRKLIIPFTGDKIQLNEEQVLEKTTIVGLDPNGTGVNGSRIMTLNRLPVEPWYYTNNDNFYLPLSRITGEAGGVEFTDELSQFNIDQGFGTNTVYTCNTAGYYNININLPFYPRFTMSPFGNQNANWMSWNDDINGGIQWRWELQKVSSGSVTVLDEVSTLEFYPSTSGQVPLTFEDVQAGIDYDLNIATSVSNIWLNAGEVLRVRVGFRVRGSNAWTWQNQPIPQPVVYTRLMLLPSRDGDMTRFEVIPANNDSLGNEEIKLRTTLPRMKCLDFITDIMRMFKLIIVEDPEDENNLIIEPIDDFYASGGEVKDWNEKIDMKRYDIKPMNEIDSTEYIFTYADDKDYFNELYQEDIGEIYGQKTIDLDNNFSRQNNYLELKFAATPTSSLYLQNGKVAPQFVNEDFDKVGVKPRILFYDGLKNGQLTLRTQPIGYTETILPQYPYCGHLDDPISPSHDLNFDTAERFYFPISEFPINTLYWQFHRKTFQNIIDPNAKILVGYFDLNSFDMSTFDYRDLIYLFNDYWRVNKIEDYDPTRRKLTKVELYKVVDVTVTAPTTLAIPTANNLCPSDMQRRRVGRKWVLVSQSGSFISEDCCTAMGGKMINGACEIPWFIPEEGATRTPNVNPNGGGKSKTDYNTKSNSKSLILGQNNYQKENSRSIIIGDNSTNIDDMMPKLILGDNISAKANDEVTIYLSDGVVKSNGQVEKKFNKVVSGIDKVRNLFAQNPEWNVIRSGTDVVREIDYTSTYNVVSGNDSDRIGYPQ